MKLYDLLRVRIFHPCRRVLAAVSNNHVAQPDGESQVGWDGPISRRAAEVVTTFLPFTFRIAATCIRFVQVQ